jgi:hypothetical protein
MSWELLWSIDPDRALMFGYGFLSCLGLVILFEGRKA